MFSKIILYSTFYKIMWNNPIHCTQPSLLLRTLVETFIPIFCAENMANLLQKDTSHSE